jgi:hypothetical protein
MDSKDVSELCCIKLDTKILVSYLAGQLRKPKINSSRFHAFTAANMKMTAFWNIAPCNLVEVDPLSRDAYCLHHQDNKRHATLPFSSP